MLQEAMHYSVFSSGKRLRPLLIYHFGEVLAIPLTKLDAPACALELIHTYSLIHDDLPMMDNDDWRRGKPSCHKMYGEAIALLAGDALQALAFERLLKTPISAPQILVMMEVLAKAIGAQGMVGGQALEFDQTLSPKEESEESWQTTINRLKTGTLFQVALEWVAIIAKIEPRIRIKLAQLGGRLGELYQLQDDLCDEVIDPQKFLMLQQRLRQGVSQTEMYLRQLFSDMDWLSIHALLSRLFPEAKKTLPHVS
jgi:geranylgeranyl pyrophosphate synthase